VQYVGEAGFAKNCIHCGDPHHFASVRMARITQYTA
jgi:hypothetical protein